MAVAPFSFQPDDGYGPPRLEMGTFALIRHSGMNGINDESIVRPLTCVWAELGREWNIRLLRQLGI